MKKEPLKNKGIVRGYLNESEIAGKHFHYDKDIKSTVEWLKQELNIVRKTLLRYSKKSFNKEFRKLESHKINFILGYVDSLINEAFKDVIGGENMAKGRKPKVKPVEKKEEKQAKPTEKKPVVA